MTVLILHGIGGQPGNHWQGWLRDELAARGYDVVMPGLPESEHPDRQVWLAEVKKAVQGIDLGDLVIVGHSLGVTTALDFLESAASPIKALVSVSGFAVDYGADFNSYFLREKSVDFGKVRPNIGQSVVVYGGDDPYVTQAALSILAEELGVTAKIIPNGGHLNTESGYATFPELLDHILNIN